MNASRVGAIAQVISGVATVFGVAISPDNAAQIAALGVAFASFLPSVWGAFKRK